MSIIHDPYTQATKLYYNFTIVQYDGYKLEPYLLA